jgi:hypothetical protein
MIRFLLTLMAVAYGFIPSIGAQSIIVEPETLVLKGAPGETVTGLVTIRNNKTADPQDSEFNKLSITFVGNNILYDWDAWQSYFAGQRELAVLDESLEAYNDSLRTWNPVDNKSLDESQTILAGESLTVLVVIADYPDLDGAGLIIQDYGPSFNPVDISVYFDERPIRVDLQHPEPIQIPDPQLAAVLDDELRDYFASSRNADAPASFASGDPIRPYHLTYLTTLSAPSLTTTPLEQKIQQLDGLEHAINLTSLNLQNQNVSSIDDLRGLKALELLNLKNNQVHNIDALQGLYNLTSVTLDGNWIDTSGGSPASQVIDSLRARQVTVVDAPQRAMKNINSWYTELNIPAESIAPESTVGPLQLPNVLAFSMGVDPLNPSTQELPSAGRDLSQAEPVTVFRYKRDLKAMGVRTTIEATADLKTWTDAIPDSIKVISDDGNGVQIVEAQFFTQGDEKLFFRLKVLSNN